MIDPDRVYAIDGFELQSLQKISEALNNPNLKVDWDKRRDLANLIDLVVSRAEVISPDPDFS